jgi:hypothetical protein
MIKHLYISIISILLFSVSFAQGDILLELGGNNSLKSYYKANKDDPNSIFNKNQLQNKKAALTLPFLDDFSQNWIYPDGNLWEDINVYVNSNFSDNPITYGVATFDGLDYTGTPYNFALPIAYGAADTLTSKQVDLSTITDSVFLSYYYQPQGNGNKPETKDSLRLEFFRLSDSSWVRMWGIPGAPNHSFKKVMIPVDTSFQNNAFQFRFINWATLSGNVDHWNLDYVYLNDNRTHADTALNDVSFITNHFNMLKEFTAMPWKHYLAALPDTADVMAESMGVTYRNNHDSLYNIEYKYEVLDDNGNGAILEIYPLGADNKADSAFSFLTEPQAVYDQIENNFSFPVDLVAESKVFQIKNYFQLVAASQDDKRDNDTVLSYQVFSDYYAYDDGSAEVGYGVQGIGSKLAHEFAVKKEDTLTAIQIYFNPIMNDLSGETFRLKVWSSLSPEIEIYTQDVTQFTSPIYSNTNEYLNYILDIPLYLTAGTYYFGWEKITNNFLNVGWDVNTNNRTKVFFNSVGVWQNPSPSIPNGSLMVRPVFGDIPPVVVSTEYLPLNQDDFIIYPNPASDALYFKTYNSSLYHVELIDVYGKTILETESKVSNKMNVTNISSGIYIVRFTNQDSNESVLKKIIISK